MKQKSSPTTRVPRPTKDYFRPLTRTCAVGALALGCTGTIADPGSKGTPGDGSMSGVGGQSTSMPTPSDNPDVGTQAPGAPDGVTITSSDGQTKFVCDATQRPPVDGLRALTTIQFENSVSDLAAWALKDAAAGPKLIAEVASALAALPDNVPVVPTNSQTLSTTFPDGGWLRADQDIQLTRVRGFYTAGIAVANALVSSNRIGSVVGSCATDQMTSNDAVCLTNFIQTFGAHVLRRPVTDEEVTFLQGVYGSNTAPDPEAYADVITVLLNMPESLYFVEHGADPIAGQDGTYGLGAFELASRLAYHVWDSAPDEELLSKARDGSLLTDSVYKAQVDRLFADGRAKTAMRRFFADYIQVQNSGGPRGTGGLNYHNVALRASDPVFQAFARNDLPTPELQGHLFDDAFAFLDYYTWTAPGTMHDLLQSELSFAKTADVSQLYGIPKWDGVSAPPALPTGTRPGLFTRAVFLAAGGHSAPILKGVYLRRYVLCDTIGKPPANAANAMLEQAENQTTRQATDTLTANSPCSACHKAWINPLGFATEDFDGLGRYRTQETVFKPDATVAATLPIDTAVTPYVNMADDKTQTKNVAELMDVIEASNKPAACMARNYFRYTFGRFEDTTVDACSLEPIRAALDNGGHFVDMLKAVVSTPAFKQRTFQ